MTKHPAYVTHGPSKNFNCDYKKANCNDQYEQYVSVVESPSTLYRCLAQTTTGRAEMDR